jgi:hypothetical protein
MSHKRSGKTAADTSALPTLKLFCLCEKVILADDGTASLITLLEHVIVATVDSSSKQADSLIAPIKWHVFSLWEREDASQLEIIKVRSQVIVGGRVVEPLRAEVVVRFEPGLRTMKVNQPFFGLPVERDRSNEFTISILIDDGKWEERGRVRVEVTFQ